MFQGDGHSLAGVVEDVMRTSCRRHKALVLRVAQAHLTWGIGLQELADNQIKMLLSCSIVAAMPARNEVIHLEKKLDVLRGVLRLRKFEQRSSSALIGQQSLQIESWGGDHRLLYRHLNVVMAGLTKRGGDLHTMQGGHRPLFPLSPASTQERTSFLHELDGSISYELPLPEQCEAPLAIRGVDVAVRSGCTGVFRCVLRVVLAVAAVLRCSS